MSPRAATSPRPRAPLAPLAPLALLLALLAAAPAHAGLRRATLAAYPRRASDFGETKKNNSEELGDALRRQLMKDNEDYMPSESEDMFPVKRQNQVQYEDEVTDDYHTDALAHDHAHSDYSTVDHRGRNVIDAMRGDVTQTVPKEPVHGRQSNLHYESPRQHRRSSPKDYKSGSQHYRIPPSEYKSPPLDFGRHVQDYRNPPQQNMNPDRQESDMSASKPDKDDKRSSEYYSKEASGNSNDKEDSKGTTEEPETSTYRDNDKMNLLDERDRKPLPTGSKSLYIPRAMADTIPSTTPSPSPSLAPTTSSSTARPASPATIPQPEQLEEPEPSESGESKKDLFYYIDDGPLNDTKLSFGFNANINVGYKKMIDSRRAGSDKKYKVLEVKDPNRRSGIARKFIQEEGKEGVYILNMDQGPFPEFRLPRNRRQYMHYDEESEAEDGAPLESHIATGRSPTKQDGPAAKASPGSPSPMVNKVGAPIVSANMFQELTQDDSAN